MTVQTVDGPRLSTAQRERPRLALALGESQPMPIKLTTAARRARDLTISDFEGVATVRELSSAGVSAGQIDAQLAAARWARHGKAIVLHNGPTDRREHEAIALINCGPRSVLTSFTGAQRWGLRGWERDDIHVLAPAGARDPRLPNVH